MRNLVVCLGLGACVGDVTGGGGTTLDGAAAGIDAAGAIADGRPSGPLPTDAAPGAADAAPGAADAAPDGPGPGASVCDRWNADRVDRSEGTWSGSVASCAAGDISAAGRSNALRLVNLYRWMADLPAVTTDAALDAKAQQCALMMHANGRLDHDPPTTWTCHSAAGAEAAGSSNISSGRGVGSVDLYMVDPGNPTTMGHRRWILSNGLGPIGLGTTDRSSCMWVFGGRGGGQAAWTAWPPPGEFPLQAVDPSFASIDDTGWTVQSGSIDLSNARVTVTAGGQTLAVTTTVLAANYGSRHALSFIPQGWTTSAGTTYHVELSNVSSPIAYDVEVVDCAR